MDEKIVIVLADGFEETEAIVPVDVLRRLGFELVIAGLDSKKVTGAHEISIEADCTLDEIDVSDIDVLILPGGMPGSRNLRDSDKVISLVRKVHEAGKINAAICAAPIALGKAGILNGKKATCYPGFEDQLSGATYTEARTEVDGNIITGKGPGAAFEFACRIAEALDRKEDLDALMEGMFVVKG